ncbi:MAG: 16S rRNA (uracil(1498)-N(3))-methyltransferase [Rhodocyclaceae bacterium]|nr:16S rRNA (uracil(1498)-N(3))-methyltransferase [Rhodocyclaceae bacterium]
MIPRIHCPFPLAPGATVELPTEASHHVTKVLRMGEGDALIVFDGRGGEWTARLHRAGKAMAAVLESFDEADRESPISVTLIQGLPAADKMDWIVQKSTELGIARIRPVVARRSVIRLSGERMERRVAHWQAVAVAAGEQCRRNRVPEVAPLIDLADYFAEAPGPSERRLMLTPGAELRLKDLEPPAGRVTLLVGPEGGFEEGELVAARLTGFRTIGLGPRVLRTETAGIAALAAMMALWGDY